MSYTPEFDQIPDKEKIWHSDSRRFIYWYVSRTRDDIWDSDTYWSIDVYDSETRKRIKTFGWSHKDGHAGESGSDLVSVRWSDDGTRLVINDKEETDIVPERASPD